MKYIAGIILGLVLGGAGVVYAKPTGLALVRTFEVDSQIDTVMKLYDADNGVVCYTYRFYSNSASISCVK